MEINVNELPGIVKLAAHLGVDQGEGPSSMGPLQRRYDASRCGEARRPSPAGTPIVDSPHMNWLSSHRLPSGDRVLLENIFRLDADDVKATLPLHGVCPFLGQEAWVASDGQVQPLLRSRRDAPDARLFRERQPTRACTTSGRAEEYKRTPGQLPAKHALPGLQYEAASGLMTDQWREYRISADAVPSCPSRTSRPISSRFDEVLKFREPGLAPVHDASGAYHITPDGLAAYASRYIRTFGFYEGRAAVHSEDGWFHVRGEWRVRSTGSAMHGAATFRKSRCPVRLPGGDYFHISTVMVHWRHMERAIGTPATIRDGHAVVQREDGKHTHVDTFRQSAPRSVVPGPRRVSQAAFARACDSGGWHHVDMTGEPLYEERFKDVEPFYNGQARVEGFDGSLAVINELGQTLSELRGPSQSQLEQLSGDMVGLWRTQTIHAAVELGVFECLPAAAEEVERLAQLHRSIGERLMRALMELDLVVKDEAGVYHSTDRGSLLTKEHPLSLADAAKHWGRESYESWAGVTQSLQTGESAFERLYGGNFFDWIQDRPADLQAYHSAMSSYARHDYRSLAKSVDFNGHDSILDAGGGAGELAFALLRSCSGLLATVMDRTEVVDSANTPEDLEGRCRFVAGDLFGKWPVKSDAVILARVLHDWPDRDALRILKRAREAMYKDSMLYVVEMILDDETEGGGLLDLNMLVMTQGAERTEEQFGCLLGQAGFSMVDLIGTRSVSSVIRARAS